MDPSSYQTFATPTNSEVVLNEVPYHSGFYYLMPVLLMSIFLYIIDFYIDSYVTQKTDVTYAAKYGAVFAFTSSIGLSFVWNHPHLVKVMVMDKIKTIIEQEHALSGGVILAYFLYILGKFLLEDYVHFCFYNFRFILATEMLSRPLSKHKGSFIGYSSVIYLEKKLITSNYLFLITV